MIAHDDDGVAVGGQRETSKVVHRRARGRHDVVEQALEDARGPREEGLLPGCPPDVERVAAHVSYGGAVGGHGHVVRAAMSHDRLESADGSKVRVEELDPGSGEVHLARAGGPSSSFGRSAGFVVRHAQCEPTDRPRGAAVYGLRSPRESTYDPAELDIEHRP